jgi:hypothetical protein
MTVIIIIITVIALPNKRVYHQLNLSCTAGTANTAPLMEALNTGHDPEPAKFP